MPDSNWTDDPVARAFDIILAHYGLERDDFINTPKRAASIYHDLLEQEPPVNAVFPLRTKAGMVLLDNYVVWGFCPHHLLPVRYEFRIGYLPENFVLGVSKLARIAKYVLRDMPLQEDIAQQVVGLIDGAVHPKGAGCIVKGEHLCMRMRGIESEQATIKTSYLKGLFLINSDTRNEFLSL